MSQPGQRPSVAIHGGAGNLSRYQGTGRIEEAHAFINDLIDSLHKDLMQGAAAVDVVTTATVALENAGMFHAGKGSGLTNKGNAELDASIMDGSNLEAGSVTLLQFTKNPILLARHIMEQTPHVLFGGFEANDLSKKIGLIQVDANYYEPCDVINGVKIVEKDTTTGTVGAVARDVYGNMAAATSTGGVLNKTSGRIGDTPIIGSGTYAKNNVGAVSCTGEGEFFQRTVAAYQVISRMEQLGESVGAAAGYTLQQIDDLKGAGGIIAIGSRGEIAMPFNTTGMYRAAIDAWDKKTVGVL